MGFKSTLISLKIPTKMATRETEKERGVHLVAPPPVPHRHKGELENTNPVKAGLKTGQTIERKTTER